MTYLNVGDTAVTKSGELFIVTTRVRQDGKVFYGDGLDTPYDHADCRLATSEDTEPSDWLRTVCIALPKLSDLDDIQGAVADLATFKASGVMSQGELKQTWLNLPEVIRQQVSDIISHHTSNVA